MDARTAAHTLTQIAAYLELLGENRFKVSAYRNAARALLGLGDDDLAAAHRSGALAQTQGLGPATLAVVRDLIEHGESRYLEQLRAEIPEGFLELARIPSLTAARLRTIHEALGISTVEELEAAARDGRLAKLPRFGAKTAAKILDGIAMLRETGALRLYLGD